MADQKYDLEDRTYYFARDCRLLVKKLKMDVTNIEGSKQLVRSSGSVGANYIEANESLSKKDFLYRIKVCRKEAKESKYWLKLLKAMNKNNQNNIIELQNEADELKRIFSSILNNSK